MARYEFGFVLEQALGHVTHAKNLQANIAGDAEVSPHWEFIEYDVEGIGKSIPVYNSNWTVRAGIRANSRISKLNRSARLDALFFHTQVPAVLAQRWLQKIPGIVSVDASPRQYDELGAFYNHQRGPSWLETLKWRMNRSCFAAARRIVSWSEWAKRGLIEDYGISDGKIEVISPGVNIEEWSRPVSPGSADAPVRILFVGGDFERKGGKQLLDAFRGLQQPGLELHLVTKQKIQPEPNIFVYNNLGPNSRELRDLYGTCDIFALPTHGDTFALVLSEAGAAGMAIISTTVAAIPEMVRNGETGLTVPPGDTAALAGALRELVTNRELRLRLGERAKSYVSQKHDARVNAGRILSLMKAEAKR